MLLTIPEDIQSKGNVNVHLNTLTVGSGEKPSIVTHDVVTISSVTVILPALSLHLGLTPAHAARSLSPTPTLCGRGDF